MAANDGNDFCLRSGSQESEVEVEAGLAPAGDSEENPFDASLPASAGCPQPLACRRITLVSASVCLWPSSLRTPQIRLRFSLIRIPVIGFGAPPKFRMNRSWGSQLNYSHFLRLGYRLICLGGHSSTHCQGYE